jgi:hypothetical protein
MRGTTAKEIRKITAEAIAALVIVGWLLFLTLAFRTAR